MERLQIFYLSDIIYKTSAVLAEGREAFALFHGADFLLPKKPYLPDWPVIACDQFTADPSYWDRVRKCSEWKISAYHLIQPEIDRNRIRGNRDRIHKMMDRYLRQEIFDEYPDSYIYVERRMSTGILRRGILGIFDLEQYDFSGTVCAPIRATEETVLDRLPARQNIRQGASMELSHAMVFCDDVRYRILETVSHRKAELPKLYDLSLMEGGGEVSGWLVQGKAKKEFEQDLFAYVQDKNLRQEIAFAVADGNHSLAAAKVCYEAAGKPDGPLRYAMAELVNLRDPAVVFYPIHRLVYETDAAELLSHLKQYCVSGGYPIPWIAGDDRGVLELDVAQESMVLPLFQRVLDECLGMHAGVLEYIHGEKELAQSASDPGCIGFLMPVLQKEDLFSSIKNGGPLPRKSFSLGHAREKRYYLEGRRLL